MNAKPVSTTAAWLLLALTAAANADCRESVHALLLNVEPVPAELQDARVLCNRAYAAGDADAGYQLALLELGPAGWNPDQAATMIRAAAAAGVPEAQYWLAWQLEAGPLLPNDPQAALAWYESAAEQSHVLALRRLADAYETGDFGLPVTPARAADLRALAARCATPAADD